MTEAMIRKKSGMASVKDMPLLQDGPPPGGFAPVRFARRIPSKGPSAMAIFLATFGAFSWGMYQVGKGNKIRRYCFVSPNERTIGWLSLRWTVLVLGCILESSKKGLSRGSRGKGKMDDFEPTQLSQELKEEKYAARRAILPILQAEEDERFVNEWKKYLEEEARIMKDVPGWKVGESVYNSGKWMPPATGELRPDIW